MEWIKADFSLKKKMELKWFMLSQCHKLFFCSKCNKTIIRFSFCDIWNFLGKGYELKPKAEADYPYLHLDRSWYHKNVIQ